MTSRGNSSISPPDQIPQQRHVNALSSGTPPPPQQFFAQQSPGLHPQGGFEYIPQQQPLLTYQAQAYGSAVNDSRGQPGASGRGGPSQGGMPQGGAPTYYQQPGQNMRPQHPQHGAAQQQQQYFLNTTNPSGIRSRGPHQPQHMVYMSPNISNMGNNIVLAPQPQVPLFTNYTQFQSYTPANPYLNGGGGGPWRPSMPGVGQPARQAHRDKMILDIKDPNTGKVINSYSEAAELEEESANTNPANEDINTKFSRMVAEKINKHDDSNQGQGPGHIDQQQSGAPPVVQAAAVPSSQQQYQQPPPQQVQQQPPQQQQPPAHQPHMMRPQGTPHPHMPPPHNFPPRGQPGMIPQQTPPPPATPPNHQQPGMVTFSNFSFPPPPLRQPTPAQIYNQRPHVPPHTQQGPQQHNQQAPPQHTQQGPPQHNTQQHTQQGPPQHTHQGPQQTPQGPLQHTPQGPPALPQQPSQQPQGPPVRQLMPSQNVPPQAPVHQQPSVQPQTPPPTAVQQQQQHQAQIPPSIHAPPVSVVSEKKVAEVKDQVKPSRAASSPPAPQPSKPVESAPKAEEPVDRVSPEQVVSKPSPPPASSTKEPSPPAKKEPSPETVQPAANAPAPVSATPSPEKETLAPEATKISEQTKDDGASTQSVKHGRKGKKKKDINGREIVGSDMDAFIDVPGGDNHVQTKDVNDQLGVTVYYTTNNALDNSSGDRNENGVEGETSAKNEFSEVDTKRGASNEANAKIAKSKEPTKAEKSKLPKENGDEFPIGQKEEAKKNSNQPSADVRPKESQKPAQAQVETKNQKLKKKKKKGKKAAQVSKSKQHNSTNSSSSEDKENSDSIEVDSKPPLPPSAADRKQSVDKSAAAQPVKSASTSSPAPAVAAKDPSPDPTPQPATKAKTPEPEPPTPASAAPESQPGPENVPSGPERDVKDTPDVPSSNQKSSPAENNIRGLSPAPQECADAAPKSVDNGLLEVALKDAKTVPVAAQPTESTGDSTKAPTPPVNDENQPPNEQSFRPRGGEEGKRIPSSTDEGVNTKQAPEKVQPKKDSKDKLQYDRNYLMGLRECASSQTKPEGLPNLEIILDKPMMSSANVRSNIPLDFTPSFFTTNTPPRHAQAIGKSSSRGRQRPGEIQMPQRVIQSVSISKDIKPLHTSEKPWKPKKEESKDEKTLEQEVLFIMNRLTPTNFEKLAVEMRKLNIDTYEKLQQLINIFFEKVTMETKFVEAYAQLCKVMAGLKVPPPPNVKENQASFRVLMLLKCQAEFEANKAEVFEDPDQKKKKIEEEEPDTPERAEKIENVLYQMKLRRMKFYGNIRFIGELFKLGLLTESIMHDCIFRLLKAKDDESLLSLCQLLTTVGSLLDTKQAKARMDQYFEQMNRIAGERKSRIKFTLKDVIDLRNKYTWIPRKEQTGPKKIDEVREDFHQEQATKQFNQSQPPPPPPQNQPGSRRGSRQRQDEKNEDGWSTVAPKAGMRIEASKMKITKTNFDDDNIQLGPGGGMSPFARWGRGSGAQPQPQQEPENRGSSNRYFALRGDDDKRNFQRSPSRGDSNVASRGMRQGPTAGHGRGKIINRGSMEEGRRDAVNSARSMMGGRSQNSSRDNSWNRDDRRMMGPRGSREGDNPMTRSDISLRPGGESLMPPPSTPSRGANTGGGYDGVSVKKLKPMSEDAMRAKAQNILEEYLNIKDIEEAKLCVRELEGQEFLNVLVSACINDVLEKSDGDRKLTGRFFHEIVKNRLISFELFHKGFSEILEFAEDLVVDYPKMWTYMGQMIAPMVVGGSLPWAQLHPLITEFLHGRLAANMIAEIFLQVKEVAGEDIAAKGWKASGIQMSTYLEDEADSFITDKNLQFVLGGAFSADLVSSDIEEMVRNKRSNEEIHSYINTLKVEKTDKQFIRALMTAVASASLKNNDGRSSLKGDMEVVKGRTELLQFYISNNPESELQALYAIQALMHRLEHPSGLTTELFYALDDVVSDESFKKWENSEEEKEGKGTCMKQLTQFFAWLKENDEPEEAS